MAIPSRLSRQRTKLNMQIDKVALEDLPRFACLVKPCRRNTTMEAEKPGLSCIARNPTPSRWSCLPINDDENPTRIHHPCSRINKSAISRGVGYHSIAIWLIWEGVLTWIEWILRAPRLSGFRRKGMNGWIDRNERFLHWFIGVNVDRFLREGDHWMKSPLDLSYSWVGVEID